MQRGKPNSNYFCKNFLNFYKYETLLYHNINMPF